MSNYLETSVNIHRIGIDPPSPAAQVVDICLHPVYTRLGGDISAPVMVAPGADGFTILQQRALCAHGQVYLDGHTTLAIQLIPHQGGLLHPMCSHRETASWGGEVITDEAMPEAECIQDHSCIQLRIITERARQNYVGIDRGKMETVGEYRPPYRSQP